jgi:hypothetical protein
MRAWVNDCSVRLLVVCTALGCASVNLHSPGTLAAVGTDSTADESRTTVRSGRFAASNVSNHLYMLALGPKGAFSTQSQREALWRALRGEDPRYVNLLGSVDRIPMDYRIEYVFNHTTPGSPDAELDRVQPWLKRLDEADRKRVGNAQTILLVKGSLERLPNAQETRLTLSALAFLSETYNGVVFDLLNRQAISARDIRRKLTDPNGLPPQVRLIGAAVDGQRGIRSVGLPKYGLFDVFLASSRTRQGAKRLGAVVDALLEGKPMPPTIQLKPCGSTKLDYGCYQVHSR